MALATEPVKLTFAVPLPVTPLSPVRSASVSTPCATVRVVVSVLSSTSDTESARPPVKASVPSSATVAVAGAVATGASLTLVTAMSTVASSVSSPSDVVMVSASDPK